ncbi:type II secretion system protein [Candidatus Saccharibacteria bacterium]|nr:type II secretion system protein [Candidatus Saccharibacteria bacterium]
METKKGFTIIEVVLVLAIAGLIFLMVFIALPALQRSQRDTQRRDDISRLTTALTQFQANNGGDVPMTRSDLCRVGNGTNDGSHFYAGNINPSDPSTYTGSKSCEFIAKYMNSSSSTINEFKDPSGDAYGIKFIAYGDGKESNFTSWVNTNVNNKTSMTKLIYVAKHAECDGEQMVWSDQGRSFAISLKLEGAGTVCIDNS